MRFADVQRMNESTLKKFLRLPGFDEHLELHRIDCLSSHGQLESFEYARETVAISTTGGDPPQAADHGARLDRGGLRARTAIQRNPRGGGRRATRGALAIARSGDGVGGTRISALIKPRCHPERNEGPLSLQAQQCIGPSLRYRMTAQLYSTSLSRSCEVVCAESAAPETGFCTSIAGNPRFFICSFRFVNIF